MVYVQIFVVYYDPDTLPALQHSIGLRKGLVGLINAYGDRCYSGSNDVVILHELLHTLGATDKYDLATGLPLYPEGYAEPDKKPLYPQHYAEIMGGHIPESPTGTRMPERLDQVLINYRTASEIGWLKH